MRAMENVDGLRSRGPSVLGTNLLQVPSSNPPEITWPLKLLADFPVAILYSMRE